METLESRKRADNRTQVRRSNEAGSNCQISIIYTRTSGHPSARGDASVHHMSLFLSDIILPSRSDPARAYDLFK